MARTLTRMTRSTEAEAVDRLVLADVELGAAGHEIADPLGERDRGRFARDEVSGDEARELSRKRILWR